MTEPRLETTPMGDVSIASCSIPVVGGLPECALHQRMGIHITEASIDRVVGMMQVEGNTQPLGLLHGGASCVLGESLGS
jgi:acyl-coenzyme A thioesterase PaaI-like protein